MTYNETMKAKPIVIVELPVFLNLVKVIWTDEEREELIDFVARNPESGDVILGTGGVRKLRWSRAGVGKRGGARVVYFYHYMDAPIYMLLAYAKAASTDLTPDQKRQVTKLTLLLKERHSVKGE